MKYQINDEILFKINDEYYCKYYKLKYGKIYFGKIVDIVHLKDEDFCSYTVKIFLDKKITIYAKEILGKADKEIAKVLFK